jgi:hypothetical protein
MAGIETIIRTKDGKQLLYLTNGIGTWTGLPTSSVTGEKIVGAFLNTSFKKPALKAEPIHAAELVALAGETSTEARVRKAFEALKRKYGKPAPTKAKASAASKRTAKAPSVPSEAELDRARFEAAMKVITELREKMGVVA